MTSYQIVCLACLVISLLIAILFFGLHFYYKKKRDKNEMFQSKKETAWAFMKRNFLFYIGALGVAMIFSFGAMLIASI